MNRKLFITCFICVVLLFSVIGSGCAKKEKETADTSNQKTNEAAVQEDTTSGTDSKCDVTITVEPTVAPVAEESNSPWKLVSESSVTTKVNYAGFLNESIGVTVGYSGAISYTADGGKSWSQSSNVSACRYGVDLHDETLIVSSGNSGVNLVSRDKGKMWGQLGNFPLKDGAFNKFISVIDKDNMYVGATKSLGVSVDGGNKWKDLALPENCTKIVGMFFLSHDIGYLLNTDGTLFKTVDACETWTTQKIDLAGERFQNYNVPSATISFQDENHGMIVISTKNYTHRCIKTEDGGNTWETVVMPKTSGQPAYLSRDGKYLTLSTATKKIWLYKLEEQ